jgi:hypothetical protein
VQQDRILVFSFNRSVNKFISPNPDSCFRGYFDGHDFIPSKIGYCESIDELYEYDYVQLFGVNGEQTSIPKREYNDLLDSMKRSYLEVYGKVQEEYYAIPHPTF